MAALLSRLLASVTAVVTAVMGVTAAGTVASAATGSATCTPTFSTNLVPSCGALWGVAADTYLSTQGPNAHRAFEQMSQQHMGIYHYYYRGDTKFPRQSEIDLANEPGKQRFLLLNWKIASDMSWADVAAGRADNRIDSQAAYLKQNYTDPFYLAIYHEPEDNVVETAGSGMTALDYRAMFRYTVNRMRANGVTNARYVWNPMGYAKWVVKPWFDQMYPGDDVVDWIGWDPYWFVSSAGKVWPGPDFAGLMTYNEGRQYPDGSTFQGTYHHMATRYPNKPLMLSEWGIQEDMQSNLSASKKAGLFQSVAQQLPSFPRLKALVYFDKSYGIGDPAPYSTEVDDSSANLAAWRALSADSYLVDPGPPSTDPEPEPTSPTPSSPVPTATAPTTAPAPTPTAPTLAPTPTPSVSTPVRPPTKNPSTGTDPESESDYEAASTPTRVRGWVRDARRSERTVRDEVTVVDSLDRARILQLQRRTPDGWQSLRQLRSAKDGTATVRMPITRRPVHYRLTVRAQEHATAARTQAQRVAPRP